MERCSSCSNEVAALVCCGGEGAEPRSDALGLTVNLHPLASGPLPKNKILDTGSQNEFLLHGGRALP